MEDEKKINPVEKGAEKLDDEQLENVAGGYGSGGNQFTVHWEDGIILK